MKRHPRLTRSQKKEIARLFIREFHDIEAEVEICSKIGEKMHLPGYMVYAYVHSIPLKLPNLPKE